jgi:uncharacterized protein with NRDE domain
VCLLVVASRVVVGTPLLIAANRDEYLVRPTSPFGELSVGPPQVLGGRDQQSGGTWLTINRYGVFAGLTNQPLGENKDPTLRSRGELPLALAAHSTAEKAVTDFVERYDPLHYNGCWLLVGDRESLFFIDFTAATELTAVHLPPGIHILENKALGAPSPKADHVRQLLGPLEGSPAAVRDGLVRVLSDHGVPEPTAEVPNTSANCIHLEGYGTRSSCVIQCGDDIGQPPRCWVSEGPPCTSPFVDVSPLWSDG